MTTFEEASRCPVCKQPGEKTNEHPAPADSSGGVVKVFVCRNGRCEGENKAWLVQVLPNGTVPTISHNPDDKKYRRLSPGQLSMGQRMVEDAVQRDLRGEE